MSGNADFELVRNCLRGDQSALAELVNRHQKPVFNAAFRLLGNREDAADATQTTFLKVFEHLDDFNPKYKLFSWVYRIAINESLGQLRRRKPQEELADTLVSSGHSPEQQCESNDLSATVQASMMQLSDEYRTVVVMKHFSGFSYREISEVLDIPEKTVKSRLYSARQILKQSLQQSDYAPYSEPTGDPT
ncbi:MAG: sigma-70 family RNA polymerase sigma factor [Gammaproteobacteria bacterium]|nr:sigma-70 family RNA polymerase sigma factor [Gammaproteobacteria bacterium]